MSVNGRRAGSELPAPGRKRGRRGRGRERGRGPGPGCGGGPGRCFAAWGDTMHPAVAVGLVFGGCCSNVVFLELLVRCEAGERLWGGGRRRGWGQGQDRGSGSGPQGWGLAGFSPPASGLGRGGRGSGARGSPGDWGGGRGFGVVVGGAGGHPGLAPSLGPALTGSAAPAGCPAPPHSLEGGRRLWGSSSRCQEEPGCGSPGPGLVLSQSDGFCGCFGGLSPSTWAPSLVLVTLVSCPDTWDLPSLLTHGPPHRSGPKASPPPLLSDPSASSK